MSSNFPGALDNNTTLPNPSAGNHTNSPSHASQHGNENDAIKATQAKVGIGASTPVANTILFGTGTGVSAWTQLTSAQLAAALSDETGTGAAVFANTPVLITPKVDTINENTVGNGVTVAGVNIKSGVIQGTPLAASSVTTANLQTGAVTYPKIGTDSSFAWASYTPTLSSISGGTLNYAKYIQLGKTVFVRFKYTMAGAGLGTTPTISLPVTAHADNSGTDSGESYPGTVSFIDAATAYYSGVVIQRTTTTVDFRYYGASGSNVNILGADATHPFTWGNGDFIQASFSYEAA